MTTRGVVVVNSSAPARIDLAGGTLDIWPLNLMFDKPVTVNMAVSIRAHAKVKLRKDGKVRLESKDRKKIVKFDSIRTMKHNNPLALLGRLAERFTPENSGIDIVTRSEAPAGAGLAGSSALNIALTFALAKVSGRRFSKEKLIEISKDVEAAHLGIPTGLQDYGAAVYGGVNIFSFPPGGMEREKIGAKTSKTLERRVLLFYSGKSRSSGVNNWEMFKRVLDKDRKTVQLFGEISRHARRAAEALRDCDTAAFDKAVAGEWNARRDLFPEISTPRIDKAIAAGMEHGATAARICGAGGGGCFFLLADEERQGAVIKAAGKHGCRRLSFSLSNSGVNI